MDTFTSARKGGRSSWGWSTILSGRDILKRERLWKIGNVATIYALNDPWVYTNEGFKLEPILNRIANPGLRVNALMKHDQTWNEGLIREISALTYVAHILQILIPTNVRADQLLWPYTDDGKVTVRSVYHPFWEAQDGSIADLDRHESRSTTTWSTVWKAYIIVKVKNFMWKLVSNSITVMQNLRRQGINVTVNCLICGMEEDREHMIYKCSWMEEIRDLGILGLRTTQYSRPTIEEWIQDRRDETCNARTIKETSWNLCMLTSWHI